MTKKTISPKARHLLERFESDSRVLGNAQADGSTNEIIIASNAATASRENLERYVGNLERTIRRVKAEFAESYPRESVKVALTSTHISVELPNGRMCTVKNPFFTTDPRRLSEISK